MQQPWQFLPIHPVLRQLVDTMIIMKVDNFSDLQISAQFYYPWSAQTNLFFTISQESVAVKSKHDTVFSTYPANFIIGASLEERTINCPNRHHVLGITFKPGGLQRLCGLPQHEITSVSVDASFILGKEINELSLKLKEAIGNKEILHLVENFLFKRITAIAPISAFDKAITSLVHANGNIEIDKISSLACLSGRQFERKCAERLGMAPKLFARLIRFSKAYMLKEANPKISWTSIAHDCGYYDQMHLIRDFKNFSGGTPTAIQHKLQNSITAVTALQGNADEVGVQ